MADHIHGRGEKDKATPSRTVRVDESSVLAKLRTFLPEMAEANAKLEAVVEREGQGQVDIEADAENKEEYIEMDLGLGVVDLLDSEAVTAAEAAVGDVGNSKGGRERGEEIDPIQRALKERETKAKRKKTLIQVVDDGQ